MDVTPSLIEWRQRRQGAKKTSTRRRFRRRKKTPGPTTWDQWPRAMDLKSTGWPLGRGAAHFFDFFYKTSAFVISANRPGLKKTPPKNILRTALLWWRAKPFAPLRTFSSYADTFFFRVRMKGGVNENCPPLCIFLLRKPPVPLGTERNYFFYTHKNIFWSLIKNGVNKT